MKKNSQPLVGLRTVNGSGAALRGGGVRRKILAEERPGEFCFFFSSWAVRHPGVPGIQEFQRGELLMCLL